MHIQRNHQVGRGNAFPQPQVHNAVIAHHPSAEHMYLLVGRLGVALLAVNFNAHFVGSKNLQTWVVAVELLQPAAYSCKLTPFYGPVQACILIPVLPGHHIIVWLPIHFIKCPLAVPHNHIPPSPGQMCRNNRSNLHILQCIFFSRQAPCLRTTGTLPVRASSHSRQSLFPLHQPCKMLGKNDGVSLKIFFFVILFRQ